MRVHHKTIAAIPVAALLATGPALAESRDFDLSPFTRINASAGIGIQVREGGTQSVRAEARDASDFEHLELSVENGTLNASANYGFLDFIFDGGLFGAVLNDGPRLTVHIALPALESIDASSGADVKIMEMGGSELHVKASSGSGIELKDISFETVVLSASSGAGIDAGGTCISVNGSVSSGADIEAGALQCKTAKAGASSGGDLTLYASALIEANASSGGEITISGNPGQVNVNTSSGGGVEIDN